MLGVQGQFAGLGTEEEAPGADDVAQIPGFELGIDLGADVVPGHVDLQPGAAAVLDNDERGLAHDPFQHHSAGHGELAGGVEGLVVLLAVEALVQAGGLGGGAYVVGEGHRRLGADFLQFLPPFGDKFVGIGGDVGHVKSFKRPFCS